MIFNRKIKMFTMVLPLLAVVFGRELLGGYPVAAFAAESEMVSSGDSSISSSQEEIEESETESSENPEESSSQEEIEESGTESSGNPEESSSREEIEESGTESSGNPEESSSQEEIEESGTESSGNPEESSSQEEIEESGTESSGNPEESSAQEETGELETDSTAKEAEVTREDDYLDETGGMGVSSLVEISVPIYNYDVLNVLIPSSYSVAFNPYGLDVRIGGDKVSNSQVLSQNYGIVNKSTRDKLVTVTLNIEDLNEGRITFVDSAEAAKNADSDVFAIYLALVPANHEEIKVNNQSLDKDITPGALANVSMEQSVQNAVALQAGENQITFRLSAAEYSFVNGGGLSLDAGSNRADSYNIMGLAADGTGVTAFTFDGVMNPNADWTKLTKGIKISVIYAYENATGEETIIEGTGAMVSR